ncbi:MAG: undecaprenyl/decaprenyl-phosphate alpha-N-acetylglucosaminyl 1-phosphate transferase, partial [Cyanobacteria bacterium P01_A01_bin.135]
MVVPLAVWAVPILDSGAAIVRRRLTGRSIFAPDRGHLHHSLLTRGWSVRQATTFITLICGVTCLSAVIGVLW